ncbi:hypothetical protein PTKIN_Ptkin04bG0121000 [Pterospermum kingtungense]
MANDLEDLMNRISLGEDDSDEDEIVIEEKWVDEDNTIGESCLIGKLMLKKPYNLDAMKTALMKAWLISTELNIREIGHRLFIFNFQSEMKKGKVILRQPWFFNKALLILKEFDGSEELESLDISHCPFWVQIYGFPIRFISEKIGVVVGEKIGEVLAVDTDDQKRAWGKWMKVRINVHVYTPLEKECWISLPDGRKIWLTFKFEKLPDFCFVCGYLSHLENDCDKAVAMQMAYLSIKRLYDVSLRAEGLKASGALVVQKNSLESPSLSVYRDETVAETQPAEIHSKKDIPSFNAGQ